MIFSYDRPFRAEPTRYTVAFPGKTVLQFDYTVIQLNRIPWRRFVNQHNPIASALMAKMKMAPRDRARVKVQCLRLLATLKLDPAKTKLIAGFVDSYLQLTDVEMKHYERELAALADQEKKDVLDILTSWERQGMEIGKEEGRQIGKEEGRQIGIEIGRQEGKEVLLLRQLQRRFGTLSEAARQNLTRLSAEQMDDLGEALFDMSSVQQVEEWLKR